MELNELGKLFTLLYVLPSIFGVGVKERTDGLPDRIQIAVEIYIVYSLSKCVTKVMTS